MQPRTSPLQKVPTRPVRAKHSLKSKLSDYSSNKSPVSIPRYVTSVFPGTDLATKRAMVNAIERYMKENPNHGIPSPLMLNNPNGILAGLI